MNSSSVTQIGKYHILCELGRGGMGIVYRAEDRFIGREVAIKTLTSTTPELMARFRNEAKFGKLNHPNIVTIYDFGEQDGVPYIVMQFVQGGSLEKMIAPGALPLPLDKRLDIIQQVCTGLGYAHMMGVVHRDIKAANVMVEPDGGVKIVDFGIARLESLSGETGNQTQTGAVIGTLHYIAPERLKGEPADGRSDIWSVGVMLYQLIAGRLPFDGEGISMLHRVVGEPHEPVTNFAPDCPDELVEVIDHALAKNPDDRYSSAEEMANDIEAINEVLKRKRAGDYLSRAQIFLEQGNLKEARTLLLELQKLAPGNQEVKRLLREVAEKQAREQKSDQLRQLLSQAEEAVLTERYADAVDLYSQAVRIDRGNSELVEKLDNAVHLRDRAKAVNDLFRGARESRERSDFSSAQAQIDKALELAPTRTDLRNEKAAILRESERVAKEDRLRRLLQQAEEAIATRRYGDAIQHARAALIIAPADQRGQEIEHDAAVRLEAERRRTLVQKVAAEIEECAAGGDFDRASDLINRALETLPNEPEFRRLRGEIDRRRRDADVSRLVENAAVEVQKLTVPSDDATTISNTARIEEALNLVQAALEQLPGEPRLLAMQSRILQQLGLVETEARRMQSIKRADAAIEALRFDQAIEILEAAVLELGPWEEAANLLDYARSELDTEARRKQIATTLRNARLLMQAEDYPGAIALLAPAAATLGEPSLSELLAQAEQQRALGERRLEALFVRLEALGKSQPRQAVELIDSQSTGLQQHPRLKTMRAEFIRRHEHEDALASAVQRGSALLAKKDWHGGMDLLESVRGAYGDSTAVRDAMSVFTTQRAAIANAAVSNAVESARKALLEGQAPVAIEQLRTAADALEFSDTILRSDWERLAQEAEKALTRKPRTNTTGEALLIGVARPQRSKLPLVGGVVAALLVAGCAAIYLIHGRASATAVPKVGDLRLDADPWATIQSITGPDGRAVPLQPDENTTPLVLHHLGYGKYIIAFVDPQNGIHREDCTFASASTTCTAKLAGYPGDGLSLEDLKSKYLTATDNEESVFLCRQASAVAKITHVTFDSSDCTDTERSLERIRREQQNYLAHAQQLIGHHDVGQALTELDKVTLKTLLSRAAELRRQAVQGQAATQP